MKLNSSAQSKKKTFVRSCFVCSGNDGEIFQQGEWCVAGIGKLNIGIRICKDCGAVFQDPAPLESVIYKYYKNLSNYTNAPTNGLPDENAKKTSEKHVNLIRKLISPGKAYEIGCATGYTLSLLKKDGWQVAGCDPSTKASALAKHHWDIDVEGSSFENARLELEEYDLLIFSHVLEHLYDPINALGLAAQYLKRDGRLFIEVPLLEYPEKWSSGYFTLEHLNYFTLHSMSNILKLSGFELDEVFIDIDFHLYPVFACIAKKNKKRNLELDVNQYEIMRSKVGEYLCAERLEWDRINLHLEKELLKQGGVVIWGAGIHTSQLLARTQTIPEDRLVCLVDSDPQKQGTTIGKFSVKSPLDIDFFDTTLSIVISSQVSESIILTTIKTMLAKADMHAKIIPLYRNFQD